MADLKSFSRTAKAVKEVQGERRAAGERAKRREPGEAPSGYNQDVWTLAIRFQRYAWDDRIELAADLPVIHDALEALVDRFEMRGRDTLGSYRHTAEGCTRRHLPENLADHCWLHLPELERPGRANSDLTWAQMVEVIMREFWSRIWDEHALDHFQRHFGEYGRLAVQHWRYLRIAQDIQSRPVVERPVMRRATMADAIKEG